MFLGEVSDGEILSTVSKCKNKTLTDSDGTDMTILKKTISCIIKPLSYIFNLSLQVFFQIK